MTNTSEATPVAASTSTSSPGRILERVTSMCQAVRNVSGNAAASTKPFEPQMKTVPASMPAAASSSASMRPVWPSQPAGGSRV